MSHLRIVISLVVSLMVLCIGCRKDTGEGRQYIELRGKTMGTTYTIRYYSYAGADLRDSITEYLKDVNDALSTYISESLISQFNQKGYLRFPVDRDGRTVRRLDGFFISNVYEAVRVHSESEGAFDPTVGPLVNAWGFGWEGKKPDFPDSARIDSLRALVGMKYIEVDRIGDTLEVRRTRAGVMLDFSAIAKGFGVDILSFLLESQSVFDYFVEIGGELRVAGESPRGGPWIVGINVPSPDAALAEVHTRVALQTAAMATSGNYRNFYLIDGRSVWHSLNPRTGYPEENNLLSVSVVHRQCMTADALATACMILGAEEALKMIEQLSKTEAYLITGDENGEMQVIMSSGFDKYLVTE